MTKHLRIIGCLLLASSLFSSPVAYGQTDAATIVGTVVDHTGAVVPKAVVTLINTGTNLKTVVSTNSEGSYIATPLKIGNYSVEVEAQGFKAITRTGIVLNVQDRLRVDFTLGVGSVNQELTVNGTAPLLQSESSALGTVIQSQQITDLPLNGRDYAQLAVLTTGVTRILESGSGIDRSVSPANHNAGGAFSVNGVRGLLNNYILDGIDNNSND